MQPSGQPQSSTGRQRDSDSDADSDADADADDDSRAPTSDSPEHAVTRAKSTSQDGRIIASATRAGPDFSRHPFTPSAARTFASTGSGVLATDPPSKGGAGSYSMPS